MTTSLLLAFLSLQALFIWGRVAVFRIEGGTPAGVRVIEAATALSIVVGTALIVTRTAQTAETPWALLDGAALGLAAGAATLFIAAWRAVRATPLSAAFCRDTPTLLLQHGPFRFTRNPFYTAYLLGHAMPLLATRSAWALPALGVMATIYIAAVRLEERKFLASPLADAWRAYAARTGRFLPRPVPRLPHGPRPHIQPPTSKESR